MGNRGFWCTIYFGQTVLDLDHQAKMVLRTVKKEIVKKSCNLGFRVIRRLVPLEQSSVLRHVDARFEPHQKEEAKVS